MYQHGNNTVTTNMLVQSIIKKLLITYNVVLVEKYDDVL